MKDNNVKCVIMAVPAGQGSVEIAFCHCCAITFTILMVEHVWRTYDDHGPGHVM